MFVGFIAVIVILLVIVGLMSTGATNGSGGVDQTKATKVLSEISALAQSIGFYKTTTANSDYTGLTVNSLNDAGIVADNDIENVPVNTNAADYATETAFAADENLIISRAVPGIHYYVVADANTNNFDLELVVTKATIPQDSTLANAIESSLTKLENSATLTDTSASADPSVADGAARLVF